MGKHESTGVIAVKDKENKEYEAELSKKLMITGGNGFMGRHLADRFIREGWEVFVIDDKSSQELTEWNLSAKFYEQSITDPDIEELFRVNNFDVVIHLAERSTAVKGDSALDNNHVNTTGLMNILRLSSSYHVGKFIYISTGSLLPHNVENATDDSPADPVTTRAVSKYLGEQYVHLWRRLFGINAIIVRLSTVYGPGQLPSHGIVSNFMYNAVRWKTVDFHGSSSATRDFIYVDDAVFAIYLAVERDFRGIYLNVSSGKAVSFKEFLNACSTFMTLPEIDYFDDIGTFQRASLDNELCKKELGWRQKFSLEQGLKATYEWYEQTNEERTRRRRRFRKDLELDIAWGRLRPYIENGLFLAFVLLVSWLQGNTPVNQVVGFDICYLYIACMGILYGKKQSIPAVIVSVFVFTVSMLSHGGELVSLLYPAPNLLHYSSYLFLGVLTGYVTDNKNRQIEAEEYKRIRIQERYEFLEKTYHESIAVKDKLYRQIVNSDDSIGWLYKIIQNLDSVEVENIFTQAATITRQIMNVDNIAIYVMGRDGFYMRQKVRFGDMTNDLPRSLKVETLPYRDEVMVKQRVYVNTTLMEYVPDLVAPIVYDGKVIAIIQLFGMDFDQWSIYEQNLFSVTSRMISMSMGRAYQYEQEIISKRFIGDTRIMKEEEFHKLEQELMTRASIQTNLTVALLKFDMAGMSYDELDRKLGRNIRAEDIIGAVGDSVYMLLDDVPEAAIEMLMMRIENAGINIVQYEKLT